MDDVDKAIVKYHYRQRGPYKKKRLPHLSITQAAELVGVAEGTMYRMTRDGQVPFIAVGRYKRIRRTDLADFMDSPLNSPTTTPSQNAATSQRSVSRGNRLRICLLLSRVKRTRRRGLGSLVWNGQR